MSNVVTYIGEDCPSLTNQKEYTVLAKVGDNMVRILDNLDDDEYIYPLSFFKPTLLSDSIKSEKLSRISEERLVNNVYNLSEEEIVTQLQLLSSHSAEYSEHTAYLELAVSRHHEKKIVLTKQITLSNAPIKLPAGTQIHCPQIIAGKGDHTVLRNAQKLVKLYEEATGITTNAEDWSKCVGQVQKAYNHKEKTTRKIDLHWVEHEGDIFEAKVGSYIEG